MHASYIMYNLLKNLAPTMNNDMLMDKKRLADGPTSVIYINSPGQRPVMLKMIHYMYTEYKPYLENIHSLTHCYTEAKSLMFNTLYLLND